MILPTCLILSEWPPTITHGDPRFDKILESAKERGILEPLTINLKWYILDGNHRLAVAKYLGIDRVPVRIWTGKEFVE